MRACVFLREFLPNTAVLSVARQTSHSRSISHMRDMFFVIDWFWGYSFDIFWVIICWFCDLKICDFAHLFRIGGVSFFSKKKRKICRFCDLHCFPHSCHVWIDEIILCPFSARQIGFDDVKECPHLCTLAYDYLRKNKGYEENIFAFFQNNLDPERLIVKFIEELDKCILGYFSFHWKYATYIITQVMGLADFWSLHPIVS